MFFQKQPENVVRPYSTQPQAEQQTQTFNTNQDIGLRLEANPDIVQSIEIHSFDVPMVAAAASQQTVEDNRVDETVLQKDMATHNVTDSTLRSKDGGHVNRLKRDTSREEVINPTNRLQKGKTYKLSKLSNGYETKINSRIPPLETWPAGTSHARHSAGQYGEPTRNYPEEIQSHNDGHHRRHERTVMKLIPVDRKDTQTYQVHELSDEGPNVQSKPAHTTTTAQNRHNQHDGRSSPGKASSDSSSMHNENGHISVPVQDEQSYRELEGNGDGVRNRLEVGTELSHGQGQDTSRHEPRTGSGTHGQRLNHHLQQYNSNKENTEHDIESETNESHGPREQMGYGREFVTDHYLRENARPGFRHDKEDGPEHVKQYGSFRRSDPSLAGPPESAEWHVERKSGYGGEGSYKDERQEERGMNRGQHDEPLQLKYVTLDRGSQHEEYPTHRTGNEDSVEIRGKKEEDGDKKEEDEQEGEEGGVYETLSKILEKKDAISRDEDIVGTENGEDKNKKQAETYHNYWVLEYSKPTFNK